MKKFMSIILIIFTFFSLSFTAFAEDIILDELITEDIVIGQFPEELFDDDYIYSPDYSDGRKRFVIDEANIFTPQQEIKLMDMTNEIYSKYGFELVLYTTDTKIYKPIQDFADDYYDYNGYGDNGMFFMISLDERDYYTSTAGYAINLFDNKKLNRLHNYVLEDLSDDQYYDAFYKYAEEVALSVDAYNNGTAHFIPLSKADASRLIKKEAIVFIMAIIIAVVIVKSFEKALNAANKKVEANNNIDYGTFILSHSNDVYVTTQISKIPKSDNNSRGGGSHRSSSGRSHGGGGGKF